MWKMRVDQKSTDLLGKKENCKLSIKIKNKRNTEKRWRLLKNLGERN